ncbi:MULTISPECIES: threonine/serine exporter family protein [Vibrio]|uniref:Threonine/Serine exporter ThrE domain-containing protein n=1 Tax=Vibrio casei TaxID=673372 RepID=A0A368LKN0_9VIBR|nr:MULTISPECIES: threonine/serine exporter family protein [Vibrio]RCS72459.1 hypothetical protein CIK83_01870 [Vibrio casei]SJN36612.1 putative inner membrane protein [Vibrio casei]HBV75202.1 hypothetical protein [Vibrio sp.]
MIDFLWALINVMLLASIPAIGFALVFNVPKSALRYCALGGAIAYGIRFTLMVYLVPIEWATFFAATIVSIIGVHWSHRFLAHPKVFTVAAMIPMVPGVYAFKAMIALVEINSRGFDPQLFSMLIENFLQAMFIIAGLAIGLAMPGLIFYRRRSVI